MESFTSLTAVAVPFPGADLDTDQIFPARFMSRPRHPGFGRYLLHDHRFDRDGLERPDFVLNRPAWRHAQILVAGENFACGSAREQAVLAVYDYGIRVVIAASISNIFAAAAAVNGLLTLTLDSQAVAALFAILRVSPGAALTVDLMAQTIQPPTGPRIGFAIGRRRKESFLRGLDPLTQALESLPLIADFETRHQPWTPVAPAS